MGDTHRAIAYALAIVGIGLSLLLPWWTASAEGMSISIGLRTGEVCYLGECHDGDMGGAFGIVGLMAMLEGAIAVFAIAWGGLVPALSGLPPQPKAIVNPILFLGFALLAYVTLDIPPIVSEVLGLERTWWFWCGIGGAVLAIVVPFVRKGERLATGDERVAVSEPPRAVALPPASVAAARPASTTAPPAPRAAPVAIDLDDAAPAVAPEVAAPTDTSQRPALRFAVATAELREDGLTVVGEDGRRRELAWSDIGGVLARDVREAPPHPDTMIVDLIPRGAPPVRLVPATRIELQAATAPAIGRDALRRAMAFARAMNPDVEIEEDTAAFLYRGAELPVWIPAELARYDARYLRT